MKLSFKILWFIALGSLMFQNATKAQTTDTVHFGCYHEPTILPQQQAGQNAQSYLTKYGGSFTPKGDITILLIYAGFETPGATSIGNQNSPRCPTLSKCRTSAITLKTNTQTPIIKKN